MSDLISSAEHAEIRAAFVDLADTFHKSTITYMYNTGSVDIYNEDRQDTVYQNYEIRCLAEYTKFDRDTVKLLSDGAISRAEIVIQILYDDLIPMGLTTVNNTVIFNQEKDKFIHKGRLYDIVYVGLEGPMEDKNILVKIFGDPEVRETT